MICTRCDGTGFLNLAILPADRLEEFCRNGDHTALKEWLDDQPWTGDVSVCDCCGNGEGWYGTPGEHYGPDDPQGKRGPYAYNGGFCECH